MDETRLRAIIREEIALAVKTLEGQMRYSDPEDPGASFLEAASSFDAYAYRGACEAADAERAEAARNPFAEPEGEAVTVEMKAVARAEVIDVLRDLRSAFYMSGLDGDYRIAERLDNVITDYEINRERAAEE